MASDPILPNFRSDVVEQLNAPTVSVTARVNSVHASFHDYAGRRWRVVWSPRCATCTHEQLHEINELAVLDNPSSRIIRSLDLDLSVSQLNRHFREHLPGLRGAVAGLSAVLKVAGGVDGALEQLTPEVVTQAIMERGFGALMRDELEVKASDVLAAARIQHEMGKNATTAGQVDLYAEAIQVLCEQAQSRMTPREFDRFMWSVRSHPRMRAIMTASVGAENVIEAQVIEGAPIEVPDSLIALL